jgi:multidrug resistance efflux pump
VQATDARLARLKAGSRPEEIEQARNEAEALEADLVRNQQELERERKLHGFASTPAQFDAALASVRRLQGQTRAAQARLKLLQAGSRPEDIAEAEAELARAKAQHDLLEAGTRTEDIAHASACVAELRGKLREIEVQLRETVVAAPEAVVVDIIPVRPGDVVAANQPVARVLRADDLWVKAYVSEIDLGKVRLNQEVQLTIDAYPKQRFTGHIMYIAASSEFTPRNVQTIDERRHQVFAIKVRVADAQGVFKSGMAADVWVPVQP